jgi:hypothetical protein
VEWETQVDYVVEPERDEVVYFFEPTPSQYLAETQLLMGSSRRAARELERLRQLENEKMRIQLRKAQFSQFVSRPAQEWTEICGQGLQLRALDTNKSELKSLKADYVSGEKGEQEITNQLQEMVVEGLGVWKTSVLQWTNGAFDHPQAINYLQYSREYFFTEGDEKRESVPSDSTSRAKSARSFFIAIQDEERRRDILCAVLSDNQEPNALPIWKSAFEGAPIVKLSATYRHNRRKNIFTLTINQLQDSLAAVSIPFIIYTPSGSLRVEVDLKEREESFDFTVEEDVDS